MRFFIALELPGTSIRQLSEVQHKLSQIIPSFRPGEPEKFHLTIAFVGEQAENLKEPLIEVLSQSVEAIPPFSVTPAYIDAFPSLHNAKIFWAGVKGDIEKLFVIRERIKDGLIKLNLEADERRFVPHIALGKVSKFTLNEAQEKQIQDYSNTQFDQIEVSSIKLFESVPEEGFHTHNTLAEIKLV